MYAAGATEIDLSAAVDHYRSHGYARVGRVFDEATFAALRIRADELMLGRVEVPGLFFQHESATGRYEDLPYGEGYVGPSLDYRKVEKLERDALFRAVIECDLYERVVRQVLEGEVVLYRAVLFNKPASGGSPLPWHQDGGRFWGLDRDPVLQLWVAIDDAPEGGGCVEVLPGSHSSGLATPLGGVVPKEHVERARAEARVLALPARAGEVLLIHNHIWHRSQPTSLGQARRAFTVCYMTAETRCLRKKRAPREFVRVFTQR
jgi:phytanoyl-CoA hydroxylase